MCVCVRACVYTLTGPEPDGVSRVSDLRRDDEVRDRLVGVVRWSPLLDAVSLAASSLSSISRLSRTAPAGRAHTATMLRVLCFGTIAALIKGADTGLPMQHATRYICTMQHATRYICNTLHLQHATCNTLHMQHATYATCSTWHAPHVAASTACAMQHLLRCHAARCTCVATTPDSLPQPQPQPQPRAGRTNRR